MPRLSALLLVAAHATPPAAAVMRAAWYSNAVLAPSAPGATGLNCSGSVPSLDLSYSSSAPIACAGIEQQRRPRMDLFSARFDATLTAPTAGSWEFRVVVARHTVEAAAQAASTTKMA